MLVNTRKDNMAVFSIIFPVEKILSLIQGKYRKVLVVGCGGCNNESLAYVNNWEICDHIDASIGRATARELDGITSVLTENCFEVKSTAVPLGGVNAVCIRYNPHPNFKPDVILALCCAAGTFGMRDDLRAAGDKIPIFQITSNGGQLAYYYFVKDNKRWIDYSRSRVIKYNLS